MLTYGYVLHCLCMVSHCLKHCVTLPEAETSYKRMPLVLFGGLVGVNSMLCGCCCVRSTAELPISNAASASVAAAAAAAVSVLRHLHAG
jgi:hypothetical protein